MDVEINPGHSRTTSQNALYEPFPFSPIPAAAINKPDKDGKFHLYRTITPASVMASLSLSWAPVKGPVGSIWYRLRFVDKLHVEDRAEAVAKRFWESLPKFSTTYAALTKKQGAFPHWPFFAREVYVAEGHSGPWGQLCWKLDRSEAVKALLIHAYGARNLHPCDGCFERWAKMAFEVAESGWPVGAAPPFWECVSHRTEWEGACSNCVYHEKGSSCSHRADHDEEETGWVGYIKKGNPRKKIRDSAPRADGGGVKSFLNSQSDFPLGEAIEEDRGAFLDRMDKLNKEFKFNKERDTLPTGIPVMTRVVVGWVSHSKVEKEALRVRQERGVVSGDGSFW